MTIGERIKQYRTTVEMTQDNVARDSDIHPVSIRKYETNKMLPQPSQLEKIAEALDVSYNALIGIDNNNLRFKTVGDLMGLIMTLHNLRFLEITGERDACNLLKADTVKLKFNPVLSNFFELFQLIYFDDQTTISLKDAFLKFKDESMLKILLEWERYNYNYLKMKKEDGYKTDERTIVIMKDLLRHKEMIEIEMQSRGAHNNPLIGL